MIEVKINYTTFAFTPSQLAELNRLIASAVAASKLHYDTPLKKRRWREYREWASN